MHSALPILFALAAASGSPSATGDVKTAVDAIFREYDRSDSPGCALGVYRDGQIAYERGYGMANLELGVANSPQTVFDIASMGKQFTAFAIHLLARDGKLSLDDDLRRWVPEIPSYGRPITIRHLLHHTSGLRDYLELLALQGVLDEDLATDDDALQILSRQKASNFAPGEEYLYSNSGYFLLSVVVKRASGQSLRDFAAARIFGPLGMRHTQYNESHTRIIPNRATGYRPMGDGFGIDMSDFEQNGDGGVLTTIEDLFLWDQNFYEPKVGDRRLIEAMQTVGVLNSGKKLDYASALSVETYRGLPVIRHSGSWVGYRSQLARFPQQRLSVACLCNLETASARRLALQVAGAYLGGLMAPPSETAAASPVSVPIEELRPLAGAYRGRESGKVLVLSVHDGKLMGQARRRSFTLLPTAPGRFRIDGLSWATGVEVERSGPGTRPRLLVASEDDGEVDTETYQPVSLWVPAVSDLAAFAGRYASEELDTTWRLSVADGNLFVRHRGISEEPLEPTVSGTFTVDGMSLVFARNASGRVTGFTLDSGRARGFVFRRV